MDDLFLRLPVIGILIRKVAVTKFTRATSTMISSTGYCGKNLGK